MKSYKKTIKNDETIIIDEKLNASSRSNRNYSLFLLVISTYILIVSCGTSDVTILFPEKGIYLPLLKIYLNLNVFLIVAPLLLVIFYINNILRLKEHFKIINIYKNKQNKNNKVYFYPSIPYIFDYAYLGSPTNSQLLFEVLSYFIMLYTPFVIFCSFYRFLDFHNAIMSIFLFICLLITILFLFSFIRYSTKNVIKKILYLILPTIMLIVGFILLYMLLFLGSHRSFMIKKQSLLFQNKFIPRINITSTQKLPIPDIKKYREYMDNALTLINKDLNYSIPIQSLPRINFNNRDFSFCNFQSTFLPFLVAKNSVFFRGILYQSYLPYASFVDTDLAFIDLWNSDLSFVTMNNVNLSFSFDWGTSFYKSRIQKSNLSYSLLWETNLSHSYISQSNLSHVDFRKTDLSYAKLIGVDLSYAILFQTNLTNIKIQDSKFLNTLILEPIGLNDDKIVQLGNMQKFSDFNNYFLATKDNMIFVDKRLELFYKIAKYATSRENRTKSKQTVIKFLKYWINNKKYIFLDNNLNIYYEEELRKWIKDKKVNGAGLTAQEINQILILQKQK